MPTEPLPVAVEGLTVRFPGSDRPALTNIDVALRPGERLLVMGPSGSGKSTLLRVLAGIVPQAVTAHVEGSVVVAGRRATDTPLPELAARAGILTQNPLDQLCLPVVEDELAFPLENMRTDPGVIGSRIGAIAHQVGIGHLLRRRTASLSGGEGQRVALATALVTDPGLLLLDEPTAMLDPAGAARVGRAMLSGGRPSTDSSRRTTLLVEHRLDELRWMPERLMLLDSDGSIGVDGPTADVFREQARKLVDGGAWLPFEVELSTVTRLRTDASRSVLEALADDAGPPPSPGRVLLRARSAEVQRDGRTVVGGVDLELRAGETTALIGPNGSGKTTLLLGFAGLLPRRGVDGGSVGMVFQHPEHQFLARSAREEVGYGLSPEDASVENALRLYQLEQVAGADPFRLSGGQQRRLSLAAVAVLNRDVLLADEPTFGQDRRTWRTVAKALEALARSGRAVVVATHDLRLAARLADRVVVMDRGRPVASGDTNAILGDVSLLDRVSLPLPPLLRWWKTTEMPVRHVVTGLDAVPA